MQRSPRASAADADLYRPYGSPPGAITREVWTGIGGNTVANIPVGAAPNLTDTLPSFEAPTNWADNYGTRMRGYITAPVTGSYTFWIASDDNSELWLSINDNPANKVRIASVPDWTDSRQWNKFSSQKSAAIPLTAGQRYYVEALQKEGGGGDNLAVGWAKPGESTSAPSEVIPGSVLSPFSGRASGDAHVDHAFAQQRCGGRTCLYAHGERKQFRERFGGALEWSESHHYLRERDPAHRGDPCG